MKVAVIGGTGTLGAPLVRLLAERGDEVRVLSRSGGDSLPTGATHHRADLISGEGLARGLDGVEVVVDAANSTKSAEETFVAGTRRLLQAGSAAGVRHHLTISIVGCDRVPLSYYRAKTAQEQALAAGSLPWSLLRATQFHPLLDAIFSAAAKRGLRPSGRAQLQPIDVTVVAARLAAAANAEPAGRLDAVAGPRIETLGELSATWKSARGGRSIPLRVPGIGKVGRALAAGELCDPAAAAPGPSFEEWLQAAP
jgi:uncharacterized protein YbjT (DUF2867 family)